MHNYLNWICVYFFNLHSNVNLSFGVPPTVTIAFNFSFLQRYFCERKTKNISINKSTVRPLTQLLIQYYFHADSFLIERNSSYGTANVQSNIQMEANQSTDGKSHFSDWQHLLPDNAH